MAGHNNTAILNAPLQPAPRSKRVTFDQTYGATTQPHVARPYSPETASSLSSTQTQAGSQGSMAATYPSNPHSFNSEQARTGTNTNGNLDGYYGSQEPQPSKTYSDNLLPSLQNTPFFHEPWEDPNFYPELDSFSDQNSAAFADQPTSIDTTFATSNNTSGVDFLNEQAMSQDFPSLYGTSFADSADYSNGINLSLNEISDFQQWGPIIDPFLLGGGINPELHEQSHDLLSAQGSSSSSFQVEDNSLDELVVDEHSREASLPQKESPFIQPHTSPAISSQEANADAPTQASGLAGDGLQPQHQPRTHARKGSSGSQRQDPKPAKKRGLPKTNTAPKATKPKATKKGKMLPTIAPQPAAALNSSTGLYFSNCGQAQAHFRHPLWRPPQNDATVPTTAQEFEYLVGQLVSAFKDTSNVQHTSNATVVRFLQTPFNDAAIEAVMWEIVETVHKFHTSGLSFQVYDPRVIEKYHKDRNLSFADRIGKIINWLKSSKAACHTVMQGRTIRLAVIAPSEFCRTVKTNKSCNTRKAAHIARGRENKKQGKNNDEAGVKDELEEEPDEEAGEGLIKEDDGGTDGETGEDDSEEDTADTTPGPTKGRAKRTVAQLSYTDLSAEEDEESLDEYQPPTKKMRHK